MVAAGESRVTRESRRSRWDSRLPCLESDFEALAEGARIATARLW